MARQIRGDKQKHIKDTLSRREFTGRSLIALIGFGVTGIAGYKMLQSTRAKALLNYYSIGHCAPSVMQTLLEINDINSPDLVQFAGAMAGGIAGPAMECGAFTAPMMFLGHMKRIPSGINEKLMVIRQGQSFYTQFNQSNGSTICSIIRSRKNEDGCRKAVYGSFNELRHGIEHPLTLSSETEESYSLIINTFENAGFHCSHNVLNRLKNHVSLKTGLYEVSWPFIGGVTMLNRTCCSLAAGVMVLSSFLAKKENSFIRVAKMNRMLKENDNTAMNNEINGFNKSINSGRELGIWFRKEFGSTSCFDICGYNFSKYQDAKKYISEGCMSKCDHITEKVAEKVATMI